MNEDTRPTPRSGSVAVLLGLIGAAFLILLFSGSLVFLGLPGMRLHGGPRLGLTLLPAFGLVGLWGLIQIGLAIWVGIDANRRGSNGFLWGLLVLFTPIVGLIVYLIVVQTQALRNGGTGGGIERAKRPCPGCASSIDAEFKHCPFCGASLGCGQCGRPVQPEWKLCPHCATPLGPGTAAVDGP